MRSRMTGQGAAAADIVSGGTTATWDPLDLDLDPRQSLSMEPGVAVLRVRMSGRVPGRVWEGKCGVLATFAAMQSSEWRTGRRWGQCRG
ncbi:hypothetical protein CVT26_003346 [Gymnopilus dilepis]|uniref:Uncharacterized protein n=1 Tax=Gymnopilus dilepis TaxID=231916 RepID=A0A409Y5J0_9AGAR|nr:hypothetical protein CVT26_003346 [Gymnopilus dilepis]